MKKTFIRHIAHYHPEYILDNHKLSAMLDTSDEWIKEKIGVEQRRCLTDYQGNFPVFEMCRRAVDRLIDNSCVDLKTIDLIISCSSTEDQQYPGPANMIDDYYSMGKPAFHLKNGCPTLVFAIETARGFLQLGHYKNILLVCGEPFTTQVDYSDRRAAVLFGDASVAMVISSEHGLIEVEDCELGGKGSMLIHSTSASARPYLMLNEALENSHQPASPRGVFCQDGKEVFRFATEVMPEKIKSFVNKNKLNFPEINYFIGHQANLVMLKNICKSLSIQSNQHLYNVDLFGNTSSAGWGATLSQTLQDQKLRLHDRVLVSVFGAGLAWGHLLLRRTADQKRPIPALEIAA